MTEWNWDVLNSKDFHWCERHQMKREIHFFTAPCAICPECEKEFEAKLNAKVDPAAD